MVKSYSLFRSIDTSLVDALCLVKSCNYSFSFIYEAISDAFDASTSSTAVFCARVYLRNTTRGTNMGSMHHSPHHPCSVSPWCWWDTAGYTHRFKARKITETSFYSEYERVAVEFYSDTVGKLHKAIGYITRSKIDAITGCM